MMSIVLAVTVLTAPDMHCNKDEPTHCSAAMRKGDAAPYDGQLLTPDLALRLGQSNERCQKEIALQKQMCDEGRDIDINSYKAEMSLDHDQFKANLDRCMTRLSDSDDLLARCEPPFYKQPWFVATVTAIATAAATASIMVVVTR